MKKILLLSALLLPSAVSAQEHKGSVFSLGYGSYDYPGTALDFSQISAATDFGISGQFGIQASIARQKLDIGSPYSRDVYALHPYYEINDMARVGVFFQRSTAFDFYDMDYYGAEAILTPAENISLEVYAGVGESDVLPDNDIRTIGGQFSYAFEGNFVMRVKLDMDTLDAGPVDYSYGYTGLGVDYHLGGLGSNLPVVLSLDYGVEDSLASSFSMDKWAFSLSVPLGGTAGATGRKLFSERGGLQWYPALPF